MTTISLKMYNRVLETLIATEGSIIDEHNGREMKVEGIGKYEANGKTYAVGLLEDQLFCINLLIVRDGQVYLTKMAIGANVDAQVKSLVMACEDYTDADLGKLTYVELFPEASVIDTTEYEAVVTRLREMQGLYIDGHDDRTKQLEWVGRYTRGDKDIPVAVYENTYFSLNQLVINKDGNVELSTMSVGGTAQTKGMDVQEGCAAYQDLFNNKLAAERLFVEEDIA